MTNFEWGMLVGIAATEGFRRIYRHFRTSARTRELDARLAPMERELGRRRGAGEQGLMREII